jgi:metallo-beta-lactamase family protein
VERTQEILYILGEFQRAGRLPKIPIFVDSPLAIKATEIFRKNKKHYDEEAQAIVDQGYDPFNMPNLRYSASTEESRAINQTRGTAIIIAGNGMCTAGRIRHHLKHNLWRPGTSLVIVGFQAQGSTGRQIVDGAKEVRLFGETVSVKAKVFTIGGFSAHADQNDLLEWAGHFESHPRVFLVHGEPSASESLAAKIKERLGLDIYIPRWKERLVLKPREVIVEKAAEPEAAADFQAVMFNTIVDLENQLKALKKVVQSSKKVEGDDVDRVKYIEEEIRALLEEKREQ